MRVSPMSLETGWTAMSWTATQLDALDCSRPTEARRQLWYLQVT